MNTTKKMYHYVHAIINYINTFVFRLVLILIQVNKNRIEI